MKKLVVLLTALLLVPVFALAQGPVLLVELPEDAQMVEDMQFEDGDFTQTYLLGSGAMVQLLRSASFDMTLAELADSDWTGYTGGEALELAQVGGYPAEGMRLTSAEDGESVDVTLVLVHVDGQTLIFQTLLPHGAAENVQAMLDSLDVLVGDEAIDDSAVVG